MSRSGPLVQWMWGDASFVGHSVAQMNPMRWSAKRNASDVISELSSLASKQTRPVVLKVLDDGHSPRASFRSEQSGSFRSERSGSLRSDGGTPQAKAATQHFNSVPDAVAHLRERLGSGSTGLDSGSAASSPEASPTNTVRQGPAAEDAADSGASSVDDGKVSLEWFAGSWKAPTGSDWMVSAAGVACKDGHAHQIAPSESAFAESSAFAFGTSGYATLVSSAASSKVLWTKSDQPGIEWVRHATADSLLPPTVFPQTVATRESLSFVVEQSAASPIVSACGHAEASSGPLAGMLEKRSRWRKEWTVRHMILREDRIDYFLTAPNSGELPRGTVSLREVIDIRATEEPGRPCCIALGQDLLSCKTQVEQQHWIEAINATTSKLRIQLVGRNDAVALEDSVPAIVSPSLSSLPAPKHASLVMIGPDGATRGLAWSKPCTVLVSSAHSCVNLMLLETSEQTTSTTDILTWGSCVGSQAGATASQCEAHSLCKVRLFDVQEGDARYPVHSMQTAPDVGASLATAPWTLAVKVSVNKLVKEQAIAHEYQAVFGCLVAALAMLVARGKKTAALVLIAVAGFLFKQAQKAPSLPSRQITFSPERLIPNAVGIQSTPEATPEAPLEATPETTLQIPTNTPQWIGTWSLDKSCSEPYDPILADMGVNYLIRKAADAANSVLTFSMDATHITVHIKIWVSTWDVIPLDGSSTPKPLPPGAKVKGTASVRLTKLSETELEMLTEFPVGHGDLRDTLTMAEDGESFTRVVVRGALSCKRVFRKVNVCSK